MKHSPEPFLKAPSSVLRALHSTWVGSWRDAKKKSTYFSSLRSSHSSRGVTCKQVITTHTINAKIEICYGVLRKTEMSYYTGSWPRGKWTVPDKGMWDQSPKELQQSTMITFKKVLLNHTLSLTLTFSVPVEFPFVAGILIV